MICIPPGCELFTYIYTARVHIWRESELILLGHDIMYALCRFPKYLHAFF